MGSRYVPGRRALQLSHLQTQWIDVTVSAGGGGDASPPSESDCDALHARVVDLRDRTLENVLHPGSPAVYEHQYSPGDLVLWCNYSLSHTHTHTHTCHLT